MIKAIKKIIDGFKTPSTNSVQSGNNSFLPFWSSVDENGKITIHSDIDIHFEGNVTFSSLKDITITSGKWNGQEDGNIYLNSNGAIEQNIEIHSHDCDCCDHESGCDCGLEHIDGRECGCKSP